MKVNRFVFQMAKFRVPEGTRCENLKFLKKIYDQQDRNAYGNLNTGAKI